MAVAAISPDFIAVVTNVGVFLAASGTVIAAIWSAAKKVKSVASDDSPSPHHKVVGGMLMDHASLIMWSESNRTVGDKVDDLADEMRELRFAIIQLKDKL